jgi:hypothetical protein
LNGLGTSALLEILKASDTPKSKHSESNNMLMTRR